MSASRISPAARIDMAGPIAPKQRHALVIQRTDATPTSSVVEVGVVRLDPAPRSRSLKPIRSNALFHSRMPAVIASRYFSGIVRSSQ
jgi:hypothetical protein